MPTKTNAGSNFTPQTLEESTGTSLAVYDPNNDVAEFQAGRLKFQVDPQFEPGDMYMTVLKLGQAMTKECQEGSARPGQWILTGEAPTEGYTIVPMAVVKTREYRNPDDKDVILCHSDDGVHGEGNPGGPCSTCPIGHWSDDVDPITGKKVPPACQERYNYIVYVTEADCIARFNMSGMAIGAARQFNSFIAAKKTGNFGVKLGATQETNKRGAKYYVPTIALTQVDPSVLKDAASQFGG